MPKLLGGTHYFVLCRTESGHRLFIEQRFGDALGRWDAGARTSPVFSIDGTKIPSLGDGLRRWITLVGPVWPGQLEPERWDDTEFTIKNVPDDVLERLDLT